MDSLQHLIAFFIKVAFAILLLAVVWWLVYAISPKRIGSTATSTASLTKNIADTDWLPSPRMYSSILGRTKPPTVNSNVYVPGPAYSGNTFNGYGTNNEANSPYGYSSYSNSGVTESIVSTTSVQTANETNTTIARNQYVRNLSVYEGGRIYTGLSFVGEAHSSFFRDGKFPIILLDQAGKVVGVSAAVAQVTWSVPGWVRFQTKISFPLPNNVPCTMIFQEGLTQVESARKPVTVPFPVKCN